MQHVITELASTIMLCLVSCHVQTRAMDGPDSPSRRSSRFLGCNANVENPMPLRPTYPETLIPLVVPTGRPALLAVPALLSRASAAFGEELEQASQAAGEAVGEAGRQALSASQVPQWSNVRVPGGLQAPNDVANLFDTSGGSVNPLLLLGAVAAVAVPALLFQVGRAAVLRGLAVLHAQISLRQTCTGCSTSQGSTGRQLMVTQACSCKVVVHSCCDCSTQQVNEHMFSKRMALCIGLPHTMHSTTFAKLCLRSTAPDHPLQPNLSTECRR